MSSKLITFTRDELSKYNGDNEECGKKIYVAISGKVFDVSSKPETYGPGHAYNIFTGKDASNALAKSSLKLEDCTPCDENSLTEKEKETLANWVKFFEERYKVIGKLVDA